MMMLTASCRSSRRLIAVLSASACLALPAAAGAQSFLAPAPLKIPKITFNQAAPPKSTQKSDPVKGTFENGYPEIKGGGSRIGFRATVIWDKQSSDAPLPGATDQDTEVDVAKKRVGVEGRIKDALEFQVEFEIKDKTLTTNSDTNAVVGSRRQPIKDAYVNIRQITELQFQVGRFKIPFSLDENTSSKKTDFINRSLAASYLAPGRDTGWMIHGRVANVLRYEFGQFKHDGDNAYSSNVDRLRAGQTTAFRVGADTSRIAKSDFGDAWFGFAYTTSPIVGIDPEGYPSVRAKTVLGSQIYPLKYFENGDRIRMGFEGRWRPGPAIVQFEYMRVTDERKDESVENTDLSRLRTQGWYISGAYAITGERQSDGLDAPKRPFLQGGFGAVEVGLRIERIWFDSEKAGTESGSSSPRAEVPYVNADRAVTFGVTWYLNHWVKIQYNIIRETITDPTLGPLPGAASFGSRVFRIQFIL